MRVEAFLVANQAAVDSSLLHMQGGGWETYKVPWFPGTVRGSVAGIVTFDHEELGSSPVLRLEVTDSEGQVEGSKASMIVDTSRPTDIPGVSSRVPFVLPFSLVVHASTVIKAAIFDAGAELAAVTFAVPDPVPDTPPVG